MTYHDRTTKEAYDKDILDKKVSEIDKFYKKYKNGKVFLTNYALSCGYIDVQKIGKGFCYIIKNATSAYHTTYYKEINGYPIGYNDFQTLSEARRHLTMNICNNKKYYYEAKIETIYQYMSKKSSNITILKESSKEKLRTSINNFMIWNQKYYTKHVIEIYKHNINENEDRKEAKQVYRKIKNAENPVDITKKDFQSF